MSISGSITTVSGEKNTSDLSGAVLAHEHLRIDLSNEVDPKGFVQDNEAVMKELVEAREHFGLGLVLELTCQGMGRDPLVLRSLSERSGVEIVCATGFYYERFHPGYVVDSSADELAGILIREIREGIDDTGIRPGVIGEIGSHGCEMSVAEERCFRAAARAAIETGLPVSTHAHLGAGAIHQLELLLEEGLSAEKICLGHQDLLADSRQHQHLAEAGAYVAFDTVGKESYQSDEARLHLVLEMLKAGHGGRILLSNDISRENYFRERGGVGYSHLFRSFLPRLEEAGVERQQIKTIVEDNPREFLTRREEGRGAR